MTAASQGVKADRSSVLDLRQKRRRPWVLDTPRAVCDPNPYQELNHAEF